MEIIFKYIQDYLISFIELINEMSPYLLLGFLFAGILYIYFPKQKVNKYLGNSNSISVINAALIGIPLPLCSCGVIPTGVSFYNSGASKGSSVSFLISTPQTGMDSIMVTYSLLGLPMAIVKPVIALFTGFFGGLMTNLFDRRSDNSQPDTTANPDDIKYNGNRTLKGMLRYAYAEFLEDIAKWLVIGLFIAAVIDVLVPESFFTAYLGNEYLEMLLILIAAIPLYVCATGSVPIAAVLMLKGLSPGAAIVFLMAGPATNAATMTVIGKVFGRKTLLLYLLSIIVGAMFFGTLINEFLPREWFLDPVSHIHTIAHTHEILPGWLKYSSSIILTGLIVNALIKKYFRRRSVVKTSPVLNNSKPDKTMRNIYIIVKGMTCNHCKATVEENIGKLSGINNVEADIVNGRVHLTGEDFDLDQIKAKIDGLGYKYEGVIE